MVETYEKPVINPQFTRPVEERIGVKFGKNNDFQTEVRRRVDEFFESTALRRRDVPQMYIKTTIIIAAFWTFYILLVFAAHTWWQALPLSTTSATWCATVGSVSRFIFIPW